jgi:hypothetical protein
MSKYEDPVLVEEGQELSFEKENRKEGVIAYTFNKVAVIIDTTGKNYKELPEIMFGTLEDKPDRDILSQPQNRIEGVDMDRVSKCIQEVAKDSGISEFWFHPYGDDDPDNKKRREEARTRLFRRHFNLTPEATGYGYILKI